LIGSHFQATGFAGGNLTYTNISKGKGNDADIYIWLSISQC
jgi:hypothetical protein